MTLRAVIYDLDGTLVDSRQDLTQAVNRALERLGHAPLDGEQVWSFVGEGAELLVRRALSAARQRDGQGEERPEELPAALVAEAMPVWRDCYSACLLDHTRLFPGLEAVLDGPPALRAVLTNKPGVFTRRILDGLGLTPRFAKVVGGDEAPRKPDPQGLLSICAALGVAPAEALMVGDSLVDLAVARAAGVRVCGVTWGHASREELEAARPDFLAESAGELGAVIAGL
jgi:phosphoglycolate phosphatase